jgi:hypothetical protein
MNLYKKTITFLIVISISGLFITACKEEPSSDNEIVATIAGEKITEEDLQKQLEILPPEYQSRFNTPEGKQQLLNILIKQKILELAAKEVGFDQRTDIRNKMEMAAIQALTQEYYKHYIQEGLWVPENELKDYYEKHKSDYTTPEKRIVSHIQQGGLEDIETIYDRLESGEDFTELAINESTAFGASDSNGFLAEVEKGNLDYSGIIGDKRIIDMIFSLDEGEYSKPIRHTKGYSILIIDRIIPPRQMTFEEAYTEIARDYVLTDDVLKNYYLENKDKFHQDEMVKVKYTYFSTLSEAQRYYNGLVSDEITFEDAVENSAVGDTYKKAGGFQNWLTRGSIIQGIGKDEKADEIIFSLENGEYSKPYPSEKGFFIFYLIERKAEGIKPFDDVKENIANQLYYEERSKASDKAYNDLIQRYGVINYLNLGEYKNMSAEEIMKDAKSSDNPQKTIEAYGAFLEMYPDHPKAHEAKFLLGFTLSEEKEYNKAKETLEEFIVEYPNSEFSDDAKWILEGMEKEHEDKIIPLIDSEENNND